MNLSAQLITYHIRQKYPNAVCSTWISCEPHLKYPILYDEHTPAAEGRIYLIDDPSFTLPNRNLSKNMIILIDADDSIDISGYPNLCKLPEEVPVQEVFSFLQEIFDRYQQWNQKLMDSRLANESVQDLLDLTDFVIPNPMLVIGMDFTVIASKKFNYGELKNAVLGSDEQTRPLVNALKQDSNYEDAYHRTGYFYYPGNAFSTPKLCVNIARSGKTLYRLMISGGEVPLDDTFGFLLEYLAKIISHALSTSTSAVYDATHTLQQIFLTLLTNPRADYVEISQQLTMEGWLSSHTYRCVLIKIGILDQKNRTLRSICSYVENTIPASCAVEHQGNAVVYINLDLCSYSWDEISQKLAHFIRDSLLNAGYSRKMLGHFNFHRQYVQASIALQMGKRMEPSRWIHQFNQIALPYLLEQTTRKLPAYMVCHERLLQLKYMDDDGHTQLYETTRCYLEHHQNITRTSEALFIHRSTLLYRLEKIKEILKTDFSDPDEWFYLLLSFRLMDLEDQSSKKQDV
jgi:hypothetical protein